MKNNDISYGKKFQFLKIIIFFSIFNAIFYFFFQRKINKVFRIFFEYQILSKYELTYIHFFSIAVVTSKKECSINFSSW